MDKQEYKEKKNTEKNILIIHRAKEYLRNVICIYDKNVIKCKKIKDEVYSLNCTSFSVVITKFLCIHLIFISYMRKKIQWHK